MLMIMNSGLKSKSIYSAFVSQQTPRHEKCQTILTEIHILLHMQFSTLQFSSTDEKFAHNIYYAKAILPNSFKYRLRNIIYVTA